MLQLSQALLYASVQSRVTRVTAEKKDRFKNRHKPKENFSAFSESEISKIVNTRSKWYSTRAATAERDITLSTFTPQDILGGRNTGPSIRCGSRDKKHHWQEYYMGNRYARPI